MFVSTAAGWTLIKYSPTKQSSSLGSRTPVRDVRWLLPWQHQSWASSNQFSDGNSRTLFNFLREKLYKKFNIHEERWLWMGQRDFETDIFFCSLQFWIYWSQTLRNTTGHLSDPFITHNHDICCSLWLEYTCTQSVPCLTFNKILKFLLYLPCHWTCRIVRSTYLSDDNTADPHIRQQTLWRPLLNSCNSSLNRCFFETFSRESTVQNWKWSLSWISLPVLADRPVHDFGIKLNLAGRHKVLSISFVNLYCLSINY